MNLKTGIMALSIAAAPMSSKAQIAQEIKTQNVEVVSKTVIDSIAKAKANYCRAQVNNIMANSNSSIGMPSLKRTPNLAKANTYSADGKMHYDAYGNVDSLFNNKHQAYRTITRDQSGKLDGYIDYKYKPNGKLDMETIYYNEYGKDNGVGKFAVHKFNDNRTATCISVSRDGKPTYVSLYKVENFNGKEVIPDIPSNCIDAYYY